MTTNSMANHGEEGARVSSCPHGRKKKTHDVNDPREGKYLLCRKGLRKNSAKTTQQQDPMPRTQPLPKKQRTTNKTKKVGRNRSTRRVPKKNATSAQPLGGKSTPLATKPRPHERLRFHLSPSASRLPACLPMWLLWVSHRTTAHKQSRDETHFGPAREAKNRPPFASTST